MTEPRIAEALRALPSVGRLLSSTPVAPLLDRYPRATVTRAIRQLLDRLRDDVRAGVPVPAGAEALAPVLLEILEGGAARGLRRVINATGVVAHTGLGRSVLPPDALDAIAQDAKGYCLLAIDRETSARATRFRYCEELLMEITGAEAACVVNNNAAATLLTLNTMADGGEVVVSRGQLVEIGGAFRIPDVLRLSGGTLVEVGSTNRTHLRDYEAAITDRTALLLRVHTSNYRMVGFVSEVGIEDLVALGRRRGVPVLDDLGAGALLDLRPYGYPEEPRVEDSVRAGADLITISADKLIGGPQGGIILGKAEYVKRVHANPLYRALRVGKLTLIALEATLRYFLDRRRALAEHPATRMLTMPLAELERRAREIAGGLAGVTGAEIGVAPDASQVGSGAWPAHEVPTFVVAVMPSAIAPDELARRLRLRPVAVFARVRDGRLLLDPRTVLPEETAELVAAVREALGSPTRGACASGPSPPGPRAPRRSPDDRRSRARR